MTLRAIAITLFVLGPCWGVVATASAADQPISAAKLVMKRGSNGKEKLAFVSKDPAFLFPAIGGADDPADGTPGGATVELFSANEGPATLVMPAGAGKPGWSVRAAGRSSFKYANPLSPTGDSPVRAALLKEGKVLKVTSRTVGGLPLATAQGAVGVRITTGSLRSCALFDAATIGKDEPGKFVARNAAAPADCSTATLGGPTCTELGDAPTCGGTCPPGSACGTRDLSTCECISSAAPCGDTYPVCNGECPVGETCGSTGGFPLPGCGCVPAATVACGSTQPACDGTCPTGLSCFPNSLVLPIGTFDFCECLSGPPGDPCGGCPPGFSCAIVPPSGDPLCYPEELCNGASGYPTCDGSCSGGATCQVVAAGPGFCVCVP